MSDMSWKDLRDLECANLRWVGESWKTYTTAMVEQTERLRNDVVDGHLSIDNYESDTADTVREQIGLIGDRFEDDLSDYATIRVSTTMLETADALEAEQLELRELVGLIEDHDFEIEGDLHEYEVNPSAALHRAIWDLKPPEWLCDRVGIDRASAWYDLASQADALVHIKPVYDSAKELCGQYQDWLRAIMSRAHDADDDAAAALSAMKENPPELPPQFGATYDDLIDDYKTALTEEVAAEMEAIANGDTDMSPEQVNQWWEDLSDAEREALIAEHPEWVGPTDGIPTTARDTANRVLLGNEIDSLDDQIASIEAQLAGARGYDEGGSADYDALQAELAELRQDRDDLASLQDQITDDEGNPAVYTLDESADPPVTQTYHLLDFGTEDEGRAVVSIGNPDEADNVNVYVPGTTAGLDSAYGGEMNSAETMARDAYRMDPSATTATVLWVDYDAPDNAYPSQEGVWDDVEAMDTAHAEDAAEDLESFTQGIRATAEGDASNLTLTGHSYGSTVVGTAATTEGVDADNVLFVASPGTSVSTADALGVEGVYATRNDADVINYATGFVHNVDPTDEAFGATVINAEADGADPVHNHGTYWSDSNIAGREDMAEVFTGLAR